MAKIIEFYIPQNFHKVSKWLLPAERGKCCHFLSWHENRRDQC
jgi:hypothetical protein